MATNKFLGIEQLARLFTQLARLEKSGLPIIQAFDILAQSEAKLRKPILLTRRYLESGHSVSLAGFEGGIFNETQKTLIRAAESSGKLAEIFLHLAEHYRKKSVRNKKIKSRLFLPALSLVLALFIQPLPALVAGGITSFDYMQCSLGRLAFIGAGIFLLIRLPKIAGHLGIERAWHRLQLRLPIVSRWIIRRQLNEFLFILALMLESGLTFVEALPKAVATVKNSILRDYFNPALAMTASGANVSETLAKVSFINRSILNIVNSSEQSGRLPYGILQFTKLEAENIELQDEALAEWMPRLVYTLVAIWIASSIIGQSIMTAVPGDI